MYYIIDLSNNSNNMLPNEFNNMYMNYNVPYLYDIINKKNFEIEEYNNIINIFNIINLNKDILILTIIYILVLIILIILPLLKYIKFNKYSFMLSFSRLLLLSKVFI
tara:strand:+ start:475 stop:795 length:321 start_codon:yes stop_codon:yes gene_type:complete